MEYFTVENLVWALFFAILAAILYTCIMQRSLSALASKILNKNADSKENAVTLEELGYKKGLSSSIAGFFAENGNYIAKAIVKVKKEEDNKDSELLFSVKEPTRYYIPGENNDKRLEKHINDRISPMKLVILIVLLLAIAFAATTVIDMLGDYASTLTESDKGKAFGITEDETTLLEEQEQANKAEELEKKEQEELERIEQQAKDELEAAENAENGQNTQADSSDTDETTDNLSQAAEQEH